jgi:hypothetical protein
MIQLKHNSKRVQVSFTEDQWKLIQSVKNSFGNSDADAVRNIVIAWLAEKSFISTVVKKQIKFENK